MQFETDTRELRQQFEQYGEIKTFFDLVEKRGIIFVTYFDSRAAVVAREQTNGMMIAGRPIDVHFSLPRENEMAQRCDREKGQGTLFMLLKQTKERLNDDIVRDTFSPFGEIKSIRRYKDQANSRFVEYFDSRACLLAHDTLNGTAFMGGVWDLKFAWDLAAVGKGETARQKRGSLPPPPQQQQGGPARRWGQAQDAPASDRAPLPKDYPQFEPEAGPPTGRAWGRSQTPVQSAGTPPPPPPGVYTHPPPPSEPSRLEQAQKVQALLASLGSATAPQPQPQRPEPAAPASLPDNIAALLMPPPPQQDVNGQASMQQLLNLLVSTEPRSASRRGN